MLCVQPFPDSEPAVLVKSLDKDVFNHLTPHPARRVIIDFLRMLVIDSFSQQTTKLGAVLDVMLEVTKQLLFACGITKCPYIKAMAGVYFKVFAIIVAVVFVIFTLFYPWQQFSVSLTVERKKGRGKKTGKEEVTQS